MAKRFLSKDLIVSEAFKMIDEKGMEFFSVRQVASKLSVQVSSLYNHIENEYDLLLEVSKRTADMYSETIAKLATGMTLEEAAHKGGDFFREFLRDHKNLYELL